MNIPPKMMNEERGTMIHEKQPANVMMKRGLNKTIV
jgi:hypothetical protein